MTKEQISALLGRPLSSVEDTNFSLYLDIAFNAVSSMLCADIESKFDTQSFVPRKGYRTLNVPIFTEIDSVKLDGTSTTSYEVRQGSSLNGEWFNSIVFDQPLFCQRVEVEADWGFYSLPTDLKMLVAQQFGMIKDQLDADIVKSKGVEDFSITLKETTKTKAFAEKYAATIAKYSSCNAGNVQHGNARRIL